MTKIKKNNLTASGRTIAEMEFINTRKKNPVSTRAVIARINRRLAKDDRQLRRNRGAWSVGDYYIINMTGNYIDSQNVDLNDLAEELDVLKRYERLVED